MSKPCQSSQDSVAEWSRALASGASPQGRGFEPHSCHHVSPKTIHTPAGEDGLPRMSRWPHRGQQRAWHAQLACDSHIVVSTCGLVAMTSASHAEGRQFDPGQVYVRFRLHAHIRRISRANTPPPHRLRLVAPHLACLVRASVFGHDGPSPSTLQSMG